MTEQATFPKKLPRWVYGGAFGCAVILAWLAWHKYRPATEAELRQLSSRTGGESGLKAIRDAHRVYATRLGIRAGRDYAESLADYELIAEPFEISEFDRNELKHLLSSPRSYRWDVARGCIPLYGFRLRFVTETDAMDVWVCLNCSLLQFVLNDKETGGAPFDPIESRMGEIAVRLFPDDAAIREAAR